MMQANPTTPRCGIYSIRHVASGKSYVGMSRNVDARWAIHKTVLRAGRHSSSALQEAWDAEGEGAFELVFLETCRTDELREKEQARMDEVGRDNLYNARYSVRDDEPDVPTLGDAISRQRRMMGMSQALLSDATGLSRSYICDIEKGRAQSPTISTLHKLGKVLHLDLISYVTDSGGNDAPQLDVADEISEIALQMRIMMARIERLQEMTIKPT